MIHSVSKIGIASQVAIKYSRALCSADLLIHEETEPVIDKCENLKYIPCAPGHDPEALQFSHSNAEIMFLPRNTTLVLLPINKSVVKTFKFVLHSKCLQA
jgi:hypothetical protein